MYVEAMVAPVKTEKKDDYFAMVRDMAPAFLDHGATSYVEAWGTDVPPGERTSFPLAVQLQDDETCTVCTITYADKATRDTVWEKVMADERFTRHMENIPMDGKRMIFGGFETIVSL